MQGTGNIEPFFMSRDGQDFEAFTLRLFDAKTKCWSIYYAWPGDVSMQNPQVGSFQNDIGWFYSRDTWEGKPIIIVYRWIAEIQTNRPCARLFLQMTEGPGNGIICRALKGSEIFEISRILSM